VRLLIVSTYAAIALGGAAREFRDTGDWTMSAVIGSLWPVQAGYMLFVEPTDPIEPRARPQPKEGKTE